MKDMFSGVFGITLFIGMAATYIMNIVQLIQNTYSTGMVTAKVIGFFIPPFGSIMGIVGWNN